MREEYRRKWPSLHAKTVERIKKATAGMSIASYFAGDCREFLAGGEAEFQVEYPELVFRPPDCQPAEPRGQTAAPTNPPVPAATARVDLDAGSAELALFLDGDNEITNSEH
jgi:hypothetical protein